MPPIRAEPGLGLSTLSQRHPGLQAAGYRPRRPDQDPTDAPPGSRYPADSHPAPGIACGRHRTIQVRPSHRPLVRQLLGRPSQPGQPAHPRVRGAADPVERDRGAVVHSGAGRQRLPRGPVGRAGLLRGMDVLFPRVAPDRLRHARGLRGDAVVELLDRAAAGHALLAVAGGGRVRAGLDRAVRRPQQTVRGKETELLHRPALPADRPGLGAVQATASWACAGDPMSAGAGLRGRDLALALLICLCWAVNFLTSAYALREIPPFLFTALRMAIVVLLLAAFMRPPPRSQWPRLAGIALFTGVLHFGTSFLALRLAGNLSSPARVTQTYVPMAMLLAWWWLGERFAWRTALGITVSFAGVLVLGFDPMVLDQPLALGVMLFSSLM